MDLPALEFPGLRILAEVGRGTTGVVYRARDLQVNRVVALKVLLFGSAAEHQVRAARFLREASVLARLMPHPNIPAIYAVMESQGQPYTIREFVEGTPLNLRVESKTLRKTEATQVLAGVEAALLRAHQQGIVHRNLRPENILVATDGTAKLVGFGQAAAVDAIIGYGTAAAALEADLESLRGVREWLHLATA